METFKAASALSEGSTRGGNGAIKPKPKAPKVKTIGFRGKPFWFFVAFLCTLMALGVMRYQWLKKDLNEQMVKTIASLNDRHQLDLKILRFEYLIKGGFDLSDYFEQHALIREYIKFVNPKLKMDDADRIIETIKKEATKYQNITPAMVLFTMEIESSFIVSSVSSAGALGLMQVNPHVWLNTNNPGNLPENLKITKNSQLLTIEGSIIAGTYILSQYKDECINLEVQNPALFEAKGYATLAQCTSQKYFGGNTNEWYYDRLKQSAGNFWFFLTNYKQTKVPHMKTATEVKPFETFQVPAW